jgi:thiamine-monophosphate kinase
VTVSQLTERELVDRIERHLPAAPAWLTVGIGDDAAVAVPERNRLEVFTVDAVVDGVHFDRRFTPAGAIGHRALAVNLSDLAAMGAAPRLALLSMALPGELPCDDFDAIVGSIAALAAAHGMTIAGGNLTRTPGPLTIDITAVGSVKPRGVLTRRGARAGDIVYVTGSIGAAAAGLLREGAHAGGETEACVERYLRPTPRVRTGLLLGRNRAPSSCIDLSDGLADGLTRLSDASAVGIVVDADAVPLEPAARAWLEARGEDPLVSSLAGGDDYELLFTVRPRLRGRLQAAIRHGGVPLTRIGVCTDGRGVTIRNGDIDRPLPQGFSHFG